MKFRSAKADAIFHIRDRLSRHWFFDGIPYDVQMKLATSFYDSMLRRGFVIRRKRKDPGGENAGA